jgi:putative glutamine amidotransferase
MTAKPLIGITTGHILDEDGRYIHRVSDSYVRSIIDAGGLPVLIPAGLTQSDLADLRARLDGLLLTGGPDIDPALFNGQPHPRVYGVDAARDAVELTLAQQAAGNGLPLLAICRGVQVLNVVLGGTLYTHLPDQLPGAVEHEHQEGTPLDLIKHPVRVTAGTRLESILGGPDVPVNSLHHQGVQRLASGLTAAACAPDGLVEAVELPDHPFAVGVQWHPECMPKVPAMRALFKNFVEAAGEKR